jgi:hypothetical protein
VKPIEAADLLRRLRSGFPKVADSADAIDLWLSELRPLKRSLAERAVRSLLVGARFTPVLAEFHEQYAIAREQAARARREEERQAEERALDELERPTLREIPAVVEYLARTSSALELPEEGSGTCSDCGRSASPLYRVGKFRVCLDDARKRQRAREKLDAPGGVAA